MRPYEVMVIFDVGTEPPLIQAVVDRVLETVRASEGTPGHIDRWGRRAFAYEVKHRREGYYVLVEFAGDARTVSELDRMLGLTDEVLRHKVIRLPEKAAARAAATAARGARSGRASGVGSRRPAAGAAAEGRAANVTEDEPGAAAVVAGSAPDGDAPSAG
ncbi:MAG: 30S ribosomal protein S6 [Acidimicrobiales bacterium]